MEMKQEYLTLKVKGNDSGVPITSKKGKSFQSFFTMKRAGWRLVCVCHYLTTSSKARGGSISVESEKLSMAQLSLFNPAMTATNI